MKGNIVTTTIERDSRLRWVGFALLFVFLPTLAAQTTSDESITIQRILITPEQLAARLTQDRADALVRIPRETFESRLRAANQQLASAKLPPRLVEARYRARLEGENLTGSAEWKIIHSAKLPGLMSLETPRDPFSLVLREARWPDNQPAYLDRLPPPGSPVGTPPSLHLLVEAPGERSLMLEWSARGLVEPGELRFEIALPSSPVAVLELDLPQDVIPTAGQPDMVITGPFIDAEPARRSWQIAFGGRTRLPLILRRPQGPDQPRSLILARQVTRQEVAPGQILCDHDIELEVLHGAIRECTLECDPRLRITDVRLAGMEGWAIEPSVDGKGPQRIHVRLRDAVQGARLELASVTPIAGDGGPRWNSPAIVVVGAVDAGENIELRVSPDMQLGEWNPGGFQLLRTRLGDDRSQTLSLTPTLLPGTHKGPRPRPTATLRTLGPDFSIEQFNEINLLPDQTVLTVRGRCLVRRGLVVRLPLRLPAGYRLQSLEVTPADLLPLTIPPSGTPPTVVIEPQRPVTPNTSMEWVARLQGPAAKPGTFAIPDLLPIGASDRTGLVRIRIPTRMEATPSPLLARNWRRPYGIPDALLGGIGILSEPSSTIVFGLTGSALEGPLQLRSRAQDQPIRIEGEIRIEPERMVVTGTARLPELVTTNDRLLMFLTSHNAKLSSCEVVDGPNRVIDINELAPASVVPWLQVLGSYSPLDAAMRVANSQRSPGTWWMVQLAQPPREATTLAFTAERLHDTPSRAERFRHVSPVLVGAWASTGIGLTSSPSALLLGSTAYAVDSLPLHERESLPLLRGRTIRVPLLLFPSAISMTGSYRVGLPSSGEVTVRGIGCRDRTPVGIGGDLAAYRVFELAQSPFAIEVQTAPSMTASPTPRIDMAELVTRVETGGGLLCRYRVQIAHWPRRDLPVLLPPDARLLALSRDGKSFDQPEWEVLRDNSAIRYVIATLPGRSIQTIELLYTLPRPRWWLSARLDSPLPEMPIPPEIVRRLWELPAELTPWNESGLIALPGEDRLAPLPALPPAWSRAFSEWTQGAEVEPPSSPLFDPAAPWTIRTENPVPFGEILRRILDLGGNERIAMVVDTEALRIAGLAPSTSVRLANSPAGSLWEAMGLSLVPCNGSALLTTPQRAAWFRANLFERSWPRSLEDAVRQATQSGRDRTGRFCTVSEWLESTVPSYADTMPPPPPGIRVWEEWTSADASGPRVMHLQRLRLLGWAIAMAMSFIVALLVARKPRIGSITLLIWLSLAAVIYLAIPLAWHEAARPSVIIAIGMGLFLILFRPVVRREQASNAARSGARHPLLPGSRVLVRLLIIAAWIVTPVRAIAPEANTIYLLENADQIALVPQSLLDTIDQLRDRALPVPTVVPLAAHYEARLTEQSLRVEAHFRIHAFQEGPAQLVLPLSGIQLRDAILDGAPTLPTRPRGEPERYAFDIRGKGSHHLLLKFSVPLSGSDPDREARFGIPELSRSRLTFDAPVNVQQLQSLNWRGAQRVFPIPTGQRLEADLGRSRNIQLRWRTEGGASTTPLIRVQELGLWELDPALSRLRSSFGYRISQGTVSALRIEVPPGVELARIELKTTESPSGNVPTALLRNWRTTRADNGPTILIADLQAPFSGELRLNAEFVPIAPLTAQSELRFPTALDASEIDGSVAIYLKDLQWGVGGESRGVSESPAEGFQRAWQAAQPGTPSLLPQRAYQRIKGEPISIRPVLQSLVSSIQGSQRLRWWLGTQRLDLLADLTWDAGPSGRLGLVEWEIPTGLQVTELTGTDVRSWSRSGNRVQIWLREPTRLVRLLARATQTSNLSGNASPWDLPIVRQPGIATSITGIRIEPPPGWTLTPTQLVQLGEDDRPSSPSELVYRTDQPSYQGRFIIRAPQADALFRVTQLVAVRERQFRIEAHARTNLSADRPHSFVWRVPATSMPMRYQWSAPEDCEITELPPWNGERSWAIEIAARPNRTEPLTLTLVGEANPDPAIIWSLPSLRIEAGTASIRVERSAVLVGPEIQTDLMSQVDRLPQLPVNAPLANDRRINSSATIWGMNRSNARLAFRVRPPRPEGTPPVLMTFVDVGLTRVADRWVVRAALEWTAEGSITLLPRWPINAIPEGLMIDGREVSPYAPWISDEASLTHQLLAVWSFPISEDSPPPWEPIRLTTSTGEAINGPIWWTVMVPPGERLARSGNATLPLPPLARNLAQIESGLKRLEWLAGMGATSEELSAEITRVEAIARVAEIRLSGPRPSGYLDTAPNGQSLADWSIELRHKLHIWRERFPDIVPTLATDRIVRGWDRLPWASAFREGTPATWNQATLSRTGIEWVSERGTVWAERVGSVWIVLSGFVVVALLAGFSKRSTWPEQVTILGAIGIVMFGWSSGFIFIPVIVIAITGRLIIWLRWASRGLFRRSLPVGRTA